MSRCVYWSISRLPIRMMSTDRDGLIREKDASLGAFYNVIGSLRTINSGFFARFAQFTPEPFVDLTNLWVAD